MLPNSLCRHLPLLFVPAPGAGLRSLGWRPFWQQQSATLPAGPVHLYLFRLILSILSSLVTARSAGPTSGRGT